MTRNKNQAQNEIERLQDIFPGQEQKLNRAAKTLDIRDKHLKKQNKFPGDENAHLIEVKLVQQENLTKSYFAAI